MYVHLGRGNLVRSKDIIGIFSLEDEANDFVALRDVGGNSYVKEDLTEGGTSYSVVLTSDRMYFSGISALTLQKRMNDKSVTGTGGYDER